MEKISSVVAQFNMCSLMMKYTLYYNSGSLAEKRAEVLVRKCLHIAPTQWSVSFQVPNSTKQGDTTAGGGESLRPHSQGGLWMDDCWCALVKGWEEEHVKSQGQLRLLGMAITTHPQFYPGLCVYAFCAFLPSSRQPGAVFCAYVALLQDKVSLSP